MRRRLLAGMVAGAGALAMLVLPAAANALAESPARPAGEAIPAPVSGAPSESVDNAGYRASSLELP